MHTTSPLKAEPTTREAPSTTCSGAGETIEPPLGGRATWLELEPDGVLLFLHQAAGRSTAVLLCPPFGWEEMCSYRRRRRWAEALAEAGFPTACIDLPGTGDSAGLPADPERLDAWTASVAGAAEWLRETTGAARLAAIGIGLGGMLACRALAEGARIDDLVLWGVPRRGRALLRALEAHAGVVAGRFGDEAPDPYLREGDLELTGFRLTAETAEALRRLDLTELQFPPEGRRRILLIGRDGPERDRRLIEHLEGSAAVATEAGADYSILMAAPQDPRIPERTIAKTIAWLEQGDGASGPSARQPFLGGSKRRVAAPRTIQLSHGPCVLSETALEISGGTFGVLTERTDQASAPVGAVWLNGGALRHTGPNRAWVEIARRWAARGVPTLRVDLAGIGDSAGDERELLSNSSLYTQGRIEETLAVIDQLVVRGVADRFVLGGLCSGAYWSLHAALHDPRVVGAFMVNLYAFYWSSELAAERQTQESVHALHGSAWRRLWRRDLSVDHFKRAVDSIHPARIRAAAGHPAERRQKPMVELALDRLRETRTEALLLFSRGEPLYDQLERQHVLARRGRWPNLVIEQIPSRDHLFRAPRLQHHVHGALDRALSRVLGDGRARSHVRSG